MADKTIKTRIQILNDSAENLEAKKTNIPLAGEIVYDQTNHKMKIGDGETALGDLKFVGGDAAQNFDVTPNEGEDDIAAITRVVDIAELHDGDTAIVKRFIATDEKNGNKYSYTAYVYDGAWKAMDGNYSADNVYFDDNLTYTVAIGTLTTPPDGSATFATKGKSVKNVLSELMAKPQPAAVAKQPSVSISSTKAKAYEVGTSVAVDFTFATDPGAYKFAPTATGVTFGNYSATFNGQTVTGQKSGSFEAVVVGDTTSLQVTGSCSQIAGDVIPKNNLGTEDSSVKISNKEWTGLSSSTKLTGYRNWFYGAKGTSEMLDVSALTSKNMRDLKAQNGGFPAKLTTNGMQQMFFAIPASANRKVTVANAVNGAPCTMAHTTVDVEGANGYTAVSYDVYYVNNASADSGSNQYAITVASK